MAVGRTAYAILGVTQAAVGQDSAPSRPASLIEGKTSTVEWREAPGRVLDSFTVVHVRVRDEDGMPLPRASVQVNWSWSSLFRRRTLAAVPRFGDATLSVLIGEPGEYELEVRGDGLQEKRVPLTVGRRAPQEVVVDLERIPRSK